MVNRLMTVPIDRENRTRSVRVAFLYTAVSLVSGETKCISKINNSVFSIYMQYCLTEENPGEFAIL